MGIILATLIGAFAGLGYHEITTPAPVHVDCNFKSVEVTHVR